MKRDESPTLFCVHGGPGLDHRSLLPGIRSLQKLFALQFIDLQWESGSSVEGYASQVCDAVRAAKPSGPIGILGHSFGGHVAIEALAAAPAFFDFGILCNTFCNAADWLEYISYTSKLLRNPSAAEIESRYNQSQKQDADFKTLMLAYAPLYFPELPADDARSIMAQWHYAAASYNDAVENIYPKIDMTQRCRRITARCLVVGGGLDKVIPPDEPHQFAKLIHTASAVVIPSAGHFPFLTQTDAFFKTIEAWY